MVLIPINIIDYVFIGKKSMSVNVDIPGIGSVRAQNAAQEDTLKALLSVTQSAIGRQRRSDSDVSNMLRKQSASAEDATSSFSTMASSAKQAGSASSSFYSRITDNLDTTNRGFSMMGAQVQQFGKDLLFASGSIISQWTKSFSGDTFTSPVQKSANSLNMAIGLAVKGVGIFGSAAGGIVSSVPGLGQLGDLFGKSISASTSVIGTVLTELNNHMAQELTGTIKNYSQFNKMGASFTESISDLRLYSTAAGMTVDQFTTAIKASRQDIGKFGANVADGSLMLARYSNYMNEFNAQGTKGGTSFRKELMLMGYGIEEQTELTAGYLASLRGVMSAEKIRDMDAKKVAEGTKQYAADLKVLADITGQDAKAAQERARQVSMEADIMAQLKTPEEVEKFQAALRSMPEYAKKGFMEYVSSGGQAITDGATNVFMAQNAKLMPMYEQQYAQMKDANVNSKEVQRTTLNSAREVAEEQRRIAQDGGAVINQAYRMGASGVGEYAKMINEATASGLYSKDAVDNSITAQEKQLKTQDLLTKSMVDAADSTQKFAVFTQELSSKYLPQYAELLKNTTSLTTDVLKSAATKITGVPSGPTDISGGVDRLLKDLVPAVKQGMELGWNSIKGSLGDWLRNYAYGGNTSTPERRAAGGPVSSNMPYIVGEEGPELRVFDSPGTILPSSVLAGLSQQLNQPDQSSPRQMQESFASTLQSIKQQAQTASDRAATIKPKENIEELPTALQTALEKVLSGPSGFVTPINEFKNQLIDNNKTQQNMLQEQIDKLKDLIDAMGENTRVNERIANELS
jgi:hypothetical protein